MQFFSHLMSLLLAVSLACAIPLSNTDSKVAVRSDHSEHSRSAIVPKSGTSNPNNVQFNLSGIRYKLTGLILQAVDIGYPELTQSLVANICGAAWSMWNSQQSEWTAEIGGQEVGVAEVVHVASYTYISPGNLQTLYSNALNYAWSQGANGAQFLVQIQDNTGAWLNIADFTGMAIED